MHIYRYKWEDGVRSNYYPTQGQGEKFSTFISRTSGFKTDYGQPNLCVRDMVSMTSGSPGGDIKKKLENVCITPDTHFLSKKDFYFGSRHDFNLQADKVKKAFPRDHVCVPQNLIKKPEIQKCDREPDVTPRKSILRQLLTLLSRCFIPCINAKNRTMEE